MATINKVKTDAPNKAKTYTWTSGSAGSFIVANYKDEYTHILLKNAGSSPVSAKFYAGDNVMGVKDLTVSVPATSEVFITLDSMRFKNAEGKIKVDCASLSVAVLEARI